MKKEEFIRKYGALAYENLLQQRQVSHAQHRASDNDKVKEWRERNPEKIIVHHREQHRKGGKHYEHSKKYKLTGLQRLRNLIRRKHGKHYHSYKQMIVPQSQIHHEWIPGTAKFRGVALVEANQHMHGYIDVIRILEGEITLFTESEIFQRGGRN